MFFPDGSGRSEQLNGADSGLERILAEFQSTPSCNYDDQILPPDSFMTSSGAHILVVYIVRIMEGTLSQIRTLPAPLSSTACRACSIPRSICPQVLCKLLEACRFWNRRADHLWPRAAELVALPTIRRPLPTGASGCITQRASSARHPPGVQWHGRVQAAAAAPAS